MDETQASAMADAILEPHLRAQNERRAEKAAVEAFKAKQRKVAWFALAGIGCGAVITYYSGVRVSHGIIFGGVVGMVAGRIVGRLQERADAT